MGSYSAPFLGGLGLRHLFVRDLVLMASIGVYAHEHEARQRVRVNIDLTVDDEAVTDRIADVVSYERLVDLVKGIVEDGGHIQLVETLAERIAAGCFFDPRVRSARIRVEKLDIFPEAAAVGVEIERLAPRARG